MSCRRSSFAPITPRVTPPSSTGERVHPRELESAHFAVHLVERLGWALDDACEVEERQLAERPEES